MTRVPPAPIVSSALSGFVVGVVATLIATGSLTHPSSSAAGTPRPTAVPTQTALLSDATLTARIHDIVTRELGPSPNKADPRLIRVSVSPGTVERSFIHRPPDQVLRTVVIRFRLNNHPLGGAWRLRAAKADVFLVMQGLYSSNLPIAGVEMTGMFPLTSHGAASPRKVLEVYIDHETAGELQWHHMARDEVNEARVWRVLDYKWVDPRFG